MKKIYLIFLTMTFISAIVVYGNNRKSNLSELQMANIELMANDEGGINLQFCHPYEKEGEAVKEGEKGRNKCMKGTPLRY